MVPAGTTTFILIGTLYPLSLPIFPTNADALLCFVLFFGRGNLLFFFLDDLLFLFEWGGFFHLFWLNVFHHDSFQAKRVEEGSFGKWLNLFWVDGANDKGPFTELNNFIVLWYFWDSMMGLIDGLELMIENTSRKSVSSCMVAMDSLTFSNSYLMAGVDRICFMSYYRWC